LVIGVELLTTRTSAGRYAILRIVVRHRSTQIGAKLTHSPSQAFAQEHAQRVPATVTNLGGDSFNIQPATVEQRFRAFDTQILKVGKRRFA
jgi:hypothetical protein